MSRFLFFVYLGYFPIGISLRGLWVLGGIRDAIIILSVRAGQAPNNGTLNNSFYCVRLLCWFPNALCWPISGVKGCEVNDAACPLPLPHLPLCRCSACHYNIDWWLTAHRNITFGGIKIPSESGAFLLILDTSTNGSHISVASSQLKTLSILLLWNHQTKVLLFNLLFIYFYV